MRNARSYAEWREAAAEFDQVTGREEWKHEEASDQYDWKLVKSRLRQIRQLRAENHIVKLVHHLRQGLYWNLGHLGNPVLYGHALIGTKQLIHDYVAEVASVLDFLCDGEFPEFDLGTKRKFFDDTATSYG